MKASLPVIGSLFALITVACGDDDGGSTPLTEAGTRDTDDTPTSPTSGEKEAGTKPIPNLHEIPSEGTEGEIMCAELGTLCHPFDNNDGEFGEQCHDVGHAGDPEACAEIYDECIAFCQAPIDAGTSDAGTRHPDDASAGHHETDAGSALCEELGHTCHAFDDGDGLGRECHEVGHAGDHEACEAIFDQCSQLCRGDAGPGHTEPMDASADGG